MVRIMENDDVSEFNLEFSLDMIASKRIKDFRKSKVLITSTPSSTKKSKRCDKTIDLVEVEYNSPYEKLTKNKSGY